MKPATSLKKKMYYKCFSNELQVRNFRKICFYLFSGRLLLNLLENLMHQIKLDKITPLSICTLIYIIVDEAGVEVLFSDKLHCRKNEVFKRFLQQMWPNPQETADLVAFTSGTLIGKLHFLCSAEN